MIALGPFLVGAALLVIGGAAKLARPADTARALRQAGSPISPTMVHVGAAVEIIFGVAAWTVAGPAPALAVAASYAGFAVFITVALGRGWSLATCGCFGEPDSPPTWLHVAIVTGLAVAAVAAAGRSGQPPLAAVASHPAWGAALMSLVAVTTGLAYLALARLPKVQAR